MTSVLRGSAALVPIAVMTCLALFANGAHAASFDCTHASVAAEKTVCAGPELSKLDEQLAAAYKAKAAAAKPSDAASLKGAQRQWVQFRNGCGAGQECLSRLYQERLAELKDDDRETSVFNFVEFSDSPTAKRLWKTVSDKLDWASNPVLASSQHERASYARIGPDSFLVMTAGIYLAQPTLGKLDELEMAGSDDGWEPLKFRPLPGNGYWALLQASGLSHGIWSTFVGALFIRPSKDGEPAVSAKDLGQFAGGDDGSCPDDADRPEDMSEAQHVESVNVSDINHDSMEDIVIQVREQNCTTKATTNKKLVFVNTGSEFRQLSDTEAAHAPQ